MKFFSGKKWDKILFVITIMVLSVFIISRSFKTPFVPVYTNLYVSSHFSQIFGENIIAAIVHEFEEQNPNLRIIFSGDDDETEADIVLFDDNEFNNFLKEASLASLDPYMHSGDHAGIQFALPLVSFVDLFFYNIDILTEAGRIRPPKTRAEFLDAARAVNRQNKAFPFALGLYGDESLRLDIYPWIWADGPEIVSGNTLSRNALNSISFIGQLNNEGLLAPETFEKTGKQRLEEFAEGKIAMLVSSSRYIPYLQKQELNFGVTAIPAASAGRNRLGLSRLYTGISSSCSIPDDAWIFINLIAGKSLTFAQTLSAVPGSYPFNFPGNYIIEDDLLSKAWEIFEAADIAEYQTGNPMEEETSRLVWERVINTLR